jgi:D-tyrosyl-tRNA(Tyr) deacylase
MKILIQRVSSASVTVDNQITGSIKRGLLVFLGVAKEDTEKDIDFIIDKIINLRIFPDENNKMNLSVSDIKGQVLLVSQFTLCADARKGRRPSYNSAAHPEKGMEYYEKTVQKLKESGMTVETGSFGADMKVSLVNDGPVTIYLDSEKSNRR